MKVSAAHVREWLLAHTGASNRELYDQFPDNPRPSLRRIANSIPDVRESRGLPPQADQDIFYTPEILESIRSRRRMITMEWRVRNYRAMTPPLSAKAIAAFRNCFRDAAAIARREKLDIELCAYHLVINLAHSASYDSDRDVFSFDWTEQFATVSSALITGGLNNLWDRFTETTLASITDMERALTMINEGIVTQGSSGSLGARPALLRIFMHSREI